jgi:hypothetical protein
MICQSTNRHNVPRDSACEKKLRDWQPCSARDKFMAEKLAEMVNVVIAILGPISSCRERNETVEG